MTNSDNQSSHSHNSHARSGRSHTMRILVYLWSEWRLEVIVAIIVILAIFLLVEQMQIRETLATWLRWFADGIAAFITGVASSIAAFVRATTLSDLTGYVLLFVALILVMWRARWRLLHAPRFTERQCPRCGGELHRSHRHASDRLLNLFVPVRRYRCRNHACGWDGLRVQKHD